MPELVFLILQIFIITLIAAIGIAVLTLAAAAAMIFIAGTDTSLEDLDFDYEE